MLRNMEFNAFKSTNDCQKIILKVVLPFINKICEGRLNEKIYGMNIAVKTRYRPI